MATNTYVALRTETVAVATPSVTFNLSGITGYTDLVIVATAQASVSTNLQMRFNGSSSAYYSNTGMRGYSTSTADSFRQTNLTSMTLCTVEDIGNPNTNFIIQIQNYSNTTTFKTALVRANQATAGTEAIVGLWRGTTGSDTPAITSITLLTGSGNLNVGSTFTIYGIAAWSGDVTPKATGGHVYSDATYYYHVFDSNGTFTALQSLSADILSIAGGGSGGGASTSTGRSAGGGGAGGLAYLASQSLSATGYSVTIGAGASAQTSQGTNGIKGSNSQFGAFTAAVGGGGGRAIGTAGSEINGGSGGGGILDYAGGTGTSGQGNNGGNGNVSTAPYSGAGGGGAGATGQANGVGGVAGQGGAGGAGVNTYSTWASVTSSGASGYYAGGGGGGGGAGTAAVGGSGGGGAGALEGSTVAIAGTAGTGGGGGGGAGQSGRTTGAAGGAGLVIVRYAK